MTEGLILQKSANALIIDARPSPITDFYLKFATFGLVNKLFKNARAKSNGIWVGGRLYLYDTRLIFEPNLVNALTQRGELSREIPLSKIRHIACRAAFLTGIIDVTWYDGNDFVNSFRTSDSKAFAREIEAAVQVARGS